MTLLARRLGLLCLFASLALTAGCSSTAKQSLVLVDLVLGAADPDASNLASVTFTATGSPTKMFPLSMLSVDDPQTFGLYFDQDVVGDVTIRAVAIPTEGCHGFSGQTGAYIPKAGDTVADKKITMVPETVCPSDGGAGAGGAGGGGPSGGAGGSGPGGGAGGSGAGGSGHGGSGPGLVPSLNNCRLFDHVGPNCPTSTEVRAVAISPDGQTVVTAGDSFNNKVKIWRFDGRTLTATGKELTGHSSGVAFSPDGTKLAVVDRAVVRLWNTDTWSAGPVLMANSSSASLVGVGFTPNGQRVVSAEQIGFAGGTLFVHAVNGNGIPALTQHVEQEPSTVTVSPVNSPDGSVGVVVGTYYGTAHVFALGASAFTGPTVVTSNPTEDAVWSVRFSPSGSLFLTGDDQIRFWSFPDGAPILPDISFGGANDLSFSPDGKYVAAAGTFGDPKVSLFAVSNHAETARHVFDDDADSIVFSPSGTAVIGGLDDCGKVFVCSD